MSKEESITLSEALSDGDLIMVEYAAHYYEGGSHESQILFRKVGNLNGITSYKGFSIASVFGGLTAQSGFTATQDTFMVNGKTLTYKGGYYLLNFANSGGSTLENNAIEIRAIYKCYI